MSNFPARDDWARVLLGDVVRHVKDKVDSPKSSGITHYLPGGGISADVLTIDGWQPVDDGVMGPAFHMRFRAGHTLYKSRVPHGVGVADRVGICANTTYVLEPVNSEHLLPELLPYLLITDDFRGFENRNNKGSTNLFLNFSDIARYEFALPPLAAQRRIVEVLQATEANINSFRMLGAEMEALRRSAIDELTFGRAGVKSTVGNHCEMQNGRPFPGNEYCDDGQPLLRPGNLDPSGYLTWDEGKTKRVPYHYREEASEFIVVPGNVLINLTAQSLEDGFMGRVCLVRDGDESLLNQRIGRFRGFSDQLQPEFLFRVLQSSIFKRHAISMCEGSKIKHLFWQHVSRFEFPLPDTTEQSRIIEELRSIDRAIIDTKRRLKSTDKLKDQLLLSALHNHVGVNV